MDMQVAEVITRADRLDFRELGVRPEALAVRDALRRRGLETPLAGRMAESEVRRRIIEGHMRAIMSTLGLDLSDDSLADTPRRVAALYVDELFSGLDYRNFPKLTTVENKMHYDEMITVSDIDVASTCEHHFITVDGKATVAYIPGERVIGLSKINRIVAFFARRPQIQERLTEQVLTALQTLLATDDVAVTIEGVHYCVKARGIRDTSSRTTTTAIGGVFKTSPATRKEFFHRVG